MFTCQHCGEDIPFGDYFWEHLSENVQCPHCGQWSKTEWDESDDGGIAWSTGKADGPGMSY